MGLGNLAKRLAIAGIAIPFVMLCIAYPVMMNIVTITLTFFGMREYLLMRSLMINRLNGMRENVNHPYQIRRVTENTSTGEKKVSDKKSDEFDLPPLFKKSSDMLQIHLRSGLATILPIVGYLYPNVKVLIGTFLIIALILFLGSMFGLLHSCCAKDDKDTLALEDFVAVCLDLFGMFYIGLSFAFGISLLILAPYVVLCTLFSNWASDAFALFMGKNFGRHKMTPRLSPNKTVEGGVGALIGAIIFAVIIYQMMAIFPVVLTTLGISKLPSVQVFAWNGLLLGVLGIIGDLVESYMKRVARVKDSGEFFNAHGGVLDRVDGLLFSFPIMYFVWAFGFF